MGEYQMVDVGKLSYYKITMWMGIRTNLSICRLNKQVFIFK